MGALSALKYGTIGLCAILTYFAYLLLSKEQNAGRARPEIIRLIYDSRVFQPFKNNAPTSLLVHYPPCVFYSEHSTILRFSNGRLVQFLGVTSARHLTSRDPSLHPAR